MMVSVDELVIGGGAVIVILLVAMIRSVNSDASEMV